MTVRLRTHHLLCVLTYVGKGYSAAFVANLDAIADRIAGGEAVRIVEGPDDICDPLLVDENAHCRTERVRRRDRVAATDLSAVLGRPVELGTALSLGSAELAGLRTAFASGRVRHACAGCEWSDLCSSVGDDGFPNVRLA